jgi:hypothetical protein
MPTYRNLVFLDHPGAASDYTPSGRGHQGKAHNQYLEAAREEGTWATQDCLIQSLWINSTMGDEDFDEWIQSFEDACIVANHPDGVDAKNRLYLEWLPLKMDSQTLALYRQKTKVE